MPPPSLKRQLSDNSLMDDDDDLDDSDSDSDASNYNSKGGKIDDPNKEGKSM